MSYYDKENDIIVPDETDLAPYIARIRAEHPELTDEAAILDMADLMWNDEYDPNHDPIVRYRADAAEVAAALEQSSTGDLASRALSGDAKAMREIDEIAYETAHFHGVTPHFGVEEQIEELNSSIKAFAAACGGKVSDFAAIDPTSRHASAVVTIPNDLSAKALVHLRCALAEADALHLCANPNQTSRLTLTLENIWEDWTVDE